MAIKNYRFKVVAAIMSKNTNLFAMNSRLRGFRRTPRLNKSLFFFLLFEELLLLLLLDKQFLVASLLLQLGLLPELLCPLLITTLGRLTALLHTHAAPLVGLASVPHTIKSKS